MLFYLYYDIVFEAQTKSVLGTFVLAIAPIPPSISVKFLYPLDCKILAAIILLYPPAQCKKKCSFGLISLIQSLRFDKGREKASSTCSASYSDSLRTSNTTLSSGLNRLSNSWGVILSTLSISRSSFVQDSKPPFKYPTTLSNPRSEEHTSELQSRP